MRRQSWFGLDVEGAGRRGAGGEVSGNRNVSYNLAFFEALTVRNRVLVQKCVNVSFGSNSG